MPPAPEGRRRPFGDDAASRGALQPRQIFKAHRDAAGSTREQDLEAGGGAGSAPGDQLRDLRICKIVSLSSSCRTQESGLYEARPVPPSGRWRFQWGGAPDAARLLPWPTSRRDLSTYSCWSSRAAASNNAPAGSPTSQHPPFPRPRCGPTNRAPCVPAARTDSPIPRQQRHPLSAPGCFRIRLRIPPSRSWRNIGACRSSGWRSTRIVAQISSVDA